MSVLHRFDGSVNDAWGHLVDINIMADQCGFEVYCRSRCCDYDEKGVTVHFSLFYDHQSDLGVGDLVSILDEDVGAFELTHHSPLGLFRIIAFVSVASRIGKTGARGDTLTCILVRINPSRDQDVIYTTSRDSKKSKVYLVWTGLLKKVPESALSA